MSDDINGFQGKYRWLSNFWPAPLTVIGISYRNSEAAYQAGKTLDLKVRETFSNLDGGAAKRKGKQLTIRADWEIARLEVMELCLRAKFAANPELGLLLCDTGDRKLIEFNTWGDNFWGVTSKGGQNILGKLLMNIREDLQHHRGE